MTNAAVDRMLTVTLRVSRFTPKPERPGRRRGGSPFGSRSKSPFGGDAAAGRTNRARGKRWTQEYTLDVHASDSVLDCLLTVKREQDPSLAFRYSCGHGMCGSDAVAINGTPTLLCTAKVRDWVRPDTPGFVGDDGFRPTGEPVDADAHALDLDALDPDTTLVIELAALPGFPTQRDLIADIDPMLDQIRKLEPYLKASGDLQVTDEGKINAFEYLQNPEQLARYELLSNCIACGVCEGSCPVYAGGDAFVGPAAMIAASRFINDSRDGATASRLTALMEPDGARACQSVRACSMHCPKGIDVGEELWQTIQKVDAARVSSEAE
ncbi:succinate dehydrogenase/fumarate reductase iron-sulfur subunit [Bifidobacterium vansinderenii]|uniref:succinate dehydrogenase n=1 Tax=Bifidobacterium vansinderenii TaxID=1984871 RepID=A0A229VXW3_9BIFI|nr:2Fe-2S iron-sulfur cluster-binding protein [Bifidobacterium vansinderenii]OXN00464.1 (2Fe-2S)-binding protein [Bifidobacterium vansinderenii]